MANGATVKMGVDVTQFRQGMQQAQQSAKTLNAQMKANEAQFKATGDREKYVSEQSKLLKQQLEAQKTAAKNAQQALDAMRKSGVEETSAEYQKMATQLANATAAMYNAQTAMNSLTESEQQAASGAGSVTTALNSIAKQVSLDAVTKGIDKIYDSLKKAGEKAVEVGKNIWDSIMDSASYADDIATMAINLGLTTTQVQQMQYVADRFEAPVESLGRTWKKVKMNITSDSDSVVEAYRELGIATHEVTPGKYGETLGQARDYLDVFWETGEALMNMTDEAERERKAQTLLGRSWEELLPLFTEGREAYEAALADAPAATDEAVQAAAALNDRMKELESSWETLKLEAIGKLAPALETAATSVKGLLDSLTEYLQTDAGQQMMQNLGDAVAKLVDKLLNVNADDLISGATKAVEGLTGALNWFTDNSDTIITVMTVITGTFTAIKLASSAVTLINALKNLGKGGGTGGLGTGTGMGTGAGGTYSGAAFTGATFTGATLTGATEQITTSNVATMYVQSMIGGNGTPTNPTTPTTNPVNPVLPGGGGFNGYNVLTNPAVQTIGNGVSNFLTGAAGGAAGAALTGAAAHALASGGSAALASGATSALTSGTATALLEAGAQGVTNAIVIDSATAAAWQTAEATIETAAAEVVGKSISTIAPKIAGGVATFLTILLTPGEAAGNGQDTAWANMLRADYEKRAGNGAPWMDNPEMVNAVNALWQAEMKDITEGISDAEYEAAMAAFNEAFRDDPKSKTMIEEQMRTYFNGMVSDYILKQKAQSGFASVFPWLMPSRKGYGISESTSLEEEAEMTYPRMAWAGGEAQAYALEDLWDVYMRGYGAKGSVIKDDFLGELLGTGESVTLDDAFESLVMANAAASIPADKLDQVLELFRQYEIFIGEYQNMPGTLFELPENIPTTLWEQLNAILNGTDGEGVPVGVTPETPDNAAQLVHDQINKNGAVPVDVMPVMEGAKGYANGIWNVPWDGYPALLHRGERVLTARENQQYTYNNYFGNVNLNNGLEIEALTESIDRRNRRQRSGYGVA